MKPISLRSLATASLFALLVSSCAFGRMRSNEPIPASSVAVINVGTSAMIVTEVLGAPTEVVQLGKRTAYRYDYTENKHTALFLLVVAFYNSDSHQDRVWVFFDEDDRVTHVGSTLKADQTEYGMPWSEED